MCIVGLHCLLINIFDIVSVLPRHLADLSAKETLRTAETFSREGKSDK